MLIVPRNDILLYGVIEWIYQSIKTTLVVP